MSVKNHNFVVFWKHNLDFQWNACLSSKIPEIFLSKKYSQSILTCLFALLLSEAIGRVAGLSKSATSKTALAFAKSTSIFFLQIYVHVCIYCALTHTHMHTLLFLSLFFYSRESYLKFIRGK